MVRALTQVLGAAVLFGATAASAQPAPAPSAASKPAWKRAAGDGEPSEGLALEALHNYAICAVKRTPDGAAKLLDLDPNGATYPAALARFAKGHSYCMNNGRIAFGGLPFQGALAEAVIAQRFAVRALPAAIAAVPTDLKPRSEPEAIGLCLVRKLPDATGALLHSTPASEPEKAALSQTVPVLPGCVVSGMTMKMNRPAVRAMMALGAYRALAGNPAES